MKLISCYIENFGGLSQLSLSFSDGLTVVKGANGSGKTTIAEFIRAMFYGFPRGNLSDLTKDKRRKYLPWQGGAYGGNLVFSHEGICYRIERTFGARPQADKFKLYEMDPLRESSRFSKDIGRELFSLDSDSFARSIYLSQIHDNGSLSTADIQAKLANLVSDVDDIGSFDKAKEQLKKKRSSLIPYRGSGGSVKETNDAIRRVDMDIHKAEQKAEELVFAEQDLSELKESRRKKQEELEDIRKRIQILSEEAVTEAKQQQYQKLLDQEEDKRKERQVILSSYPAGVPDEPELDEVQNIADRMALYRLKPSLSQTEKQAQETIEKFGGMFAEGIPTEEELKRARDDYNEIMKAENTKNTQKLSAKEQSQFTFLVDFFHGDVPDEARLSAWKDEADQCEKLRQKEEQAVLSDEDVRQLKEQEQFFSQGVPKQEQLNEAKSWAERIRKLTDENTEIAAEVVPEEAHDTPKRKNLFLLLLIVGLAAVLGGIGCFIAKALTFGMIALAAGLVLLIGAVYQNLSQSLNRQAQLPSLSQNVLLENRERIERNRREIEDLSEKLEKFLSHYGDGHGSYEEQLAGIQSRLTLFCSLQKRKEAAEENRGEIHKQLMDLTLHLQGELQAYLPDVSDLLKAVALLDSYQKEYNRLQNRKAELEEESRQTESILCGLLDKLTGFLIRYDPSVTPKTYEGCLTDLSINAQNYTKALAQENERKEKEKTRLQNLKECSSRAEAFLTKYQLTPDEFNQETVRKIREDVSSIRRLSREIHALSAEQKQFWEENEKALLMTPRTESDEEDDLTSVKKAEDAAKKALDELNSEITEKEQSLRLLRRIAEELPQKQDESERLKEKMETERHTADLLDQTLALLEKAKNSLNNRYLGPIRKHFDDYMGMLGDIEKEGEVFIDPNLIIKMERNGEARELSSFSVGQTDIVMLCMRIALVDALYQDEAPLLILDDPFVNLDDENMKEAMALLRNLSEEHQILYLVCSETRKPKKGIGLTEAAYIPLG